MRTNRILIGTTLAAALALLACLPADAALVNLWRLDETAGTTAPNSIGAGTVGTLVNGPAWTADSERGKVLAFDGSDDYGTAGTVPALTVASNYAWSFWANSTQGANNNVVFGNRFDGGGNYWAKFTTSRFEYVVNGTQMGIDYADMPTNAWTHHMVVKSGNTLTYYRNGLAGGTSTVTADMPALPLRWGGDPTTERWGGRMDDIALFDHAASATEAHYAMIGNFSRFSAVKAPSFSETFSGNLDQWDAVTKGLESNFAGGYNAPAVSGGQLTLSGTGQFNYWRGSSVASKTLFDVPAGGELRFDVDRVSLAGSGSGLRSSLWMYANNDNFLHFSQNTEGNSGFAYNANNSAPTGSGNNLGRADYLDTNVGPNYGNHRMSLVHDGQYVKMYVDGKYLASQAATFSSNISLMLTGQARAAGDTVSAVFDNAAVSTRMRPNLYDNFNGTSIDASKWTVVRKGLENQGSYPGSLAATLENGVLTFRGTTGSQYWYGLTLRTANTFAIENGMTFSVQREALDRGTASAVRSSVWIWADDTHFLHFSQNYGENGWQYNYSDGGGGAPTGGGINIAAFDALDSQDLSNQMLIQLRRSGTTVWMDMYLDGVLGATQQFNNWGDRAFYYMLTGQPRASGDSVYAAFDNVEFTAPEPATVGLLALGLAGLGGKLRRRLRKA